MAQETNPSGVKHSLDDQLILHEGKRRQIYYDTLGYASIGVGRNLSSRGLREDEIALMLKNDIAEAMGELDRALPWWRNLDDVRQKVLVDMCFNLGVTTLLTFRRTLAAIKLQAWDTAAANMLQSKWAGQVKGRAVRLAEMMRTGRDYEK